MTAPAKVGRLAAAIAVIAASTVALAGPASAAITTTVNGTTFTTTLSAPGTVNVTCASNQVQVNGSNIGLQCSVTTGFSINGSSGDDTISVAGVNSTSFPVATGGMVVSGNGGNDTLTGGGITSVSEPYIALYGGDGNDHLIGGTGKTTMFGGPGDDTLDGGSYYTSISGDAGRDTVNGGSGYDSVYENLADLPDGPITGGAGGANLDLRGARHVWLKGRATNGCDVVASNDTHAEVLSVDSGFTSCQVTSFGDLHDVVVAGLAPATSIDVPASYTNELLDVYTGGAAVNDTVNHTITRAGFGQVTYPAYFGGSTALTLHQTYPASVSLHAFVHSVLRDLNGLQAPDSQINSTVAAFTTFGTSRLTYTTGRANTPEWRGLQVDRAFRIFLGRTPDAGGRTYWMNRIAGGTRVWEVKSSVMASPEFYTDSGSTPTGFVTAVYQLVLGRVPDAGGLAYWVNRLNTGSLRSSVSNSLLTASESLQAEVTYQFRVLIGRNPTSAELTTWAPIIRDQATGDAQLHAFLAASGSYLTRAS